MCRILAPMVVIKSKATAAIIVQKTAKIGTKTSPVKALEEMVDGMLIGIDCQNKKLLS